MPVLISLAVLLGQSAPAETTGSGGAVVIVGVLLVTVVIGIVVARRSKQ
ncbi:hypothetical protein ACE2AJ_11420 [Aquihabitans daechungensis]